MNNQSVILFEDIYFVFITLPCLIYYQTNNISLWVTYLPTQWALVYASTKVPGDQAFPFLPAFTSTLRAWQPPCYFVNTLVSFYQSSVISMTISANLNKYIWSILNLLSSVPYTKVWSFCRWNGDEQDKGWNCLACFMPFSISVSGFFI